MRRLLVLGCLGVLFTGCEPNINQRTFLVEQPTVLAIRSDPAEAAPGSAVTYTALVAGPSGEIGADASMAWAYCNDRKPLVELGPVSSRCMTVASADYLQQLGAGITVSAMLPLQACRNFGPDVPPPLPGEPFGRPVDADLTGGYYQPLRLVVDAEGAEVLAIGDTRIACGISGVTPEVSHDYSKRYASNANPVLDQISMDGTTLNPPTPDEPVTNAIAAGQKVTLHAAWQACDHAPCSGAEPYVAYDIATKALVDHQESILASWYVTGGDLADDRSNPGAGASSADNTFTAPKQPGLVYMWVVLLDERGGQSWQSYRFDVR